MSIKRANDSDVANNGLPEINYHLGGDKYLIIVNFANTLRIHIRDYKSRADGFYFPTRAGVSIPPFVWVSLVRELSTIWVPSENEQVEIIRNSLMLTSTKIDQKPHVVMQMFFLKKDHSRQFQNGCTTLNADQWNKMKEISEEVTKKAINMLFSEVLPGIILAEANNQMPPSSQQPTANDPDIDALLTTSLIELFSEHFGRAIFDVFECYGCDNGLGNQLGHECVTFDFDRRVSSFGDIAATFMDLKKYAADFVIKNAQLCNYIIDNIKSYSFNDLVKNGKEMYIASDPNPIRYF